MHTDDIISLYGGELEAWCDDPVDRWQYRIQTRNQNWWKRLKKMGLKETARQYSHYSGGPVDWIVFMATKPVVDNLRLAVPINVPD